MPEQPLVLTPSRIPRPLPLCFNCSLMRSAAASVSVITVIDEQELPVLSHQLSLFVLHIQYRQ